MKRLLSLLFCLLVSSVSLAETYINTTGSDDKTAISGFDTVSFFTTKKAVPGKPEFEFSHLGAKWLFSSAENMKLFHENPEKYMPEWGGQCAWCVSENCLSQKKVDGSFEFLSGKLYLFSPGNNKKSGALDDFMYGRWPQSRRVSDGQGNWAELKKKLEDGTLTQPNASTYRKTRFD
jgi:YHS domain-containing protein